MVELQHKTPEPFPGGAAFAFGDEVLTLENHPLFGRQPFQEVEPADLGLLGNGETDVRGVGLNVDGLTFAPGGKTIKEGSL